MIPFCKPDLGEKELKAIDDVFDSGWFVLGPRSAEFEAMFAEYVGAKHAIFVDSGTSALFLAAQALKNDIGDKRIIHTPSLTFCATSEVLVHAGLIPYFVDVDLESLCVDEFRGFPTVPVHLLGNRAKAGAKIYDSAHRIERGDVKDSTAIWCYSFYATKNISAVHGGMICTNDDELNTWFRKARDHGLDMGTKERYTQKYKQYDVEFVGWRVKGNDLMAAIGMEQLKNLDRFNEARMGQVDRYNYAFGLENTGKHIYHILVNDRDEFMQFMFDAGIQCTVHFRPLHTMTAYKGYMHDPLPNTEYIGEHIVSLPLYPQLAQADQQYIIRKVKESGKLIV